MKASPATDALAASLQAALRLCAERLPPPLAGESILRDLRATEATPTPHAVRAFSGRLLQAGLVTAAEGLLGELARLQPERPLGWSGLAEAAEARRLWSSALHLWNVVAEKASDRPPAYAFASRARILDEMGRSKEAAAEIEELARRFDPEPFRSLFQAQSAARRRQWPEALDLWDRAAERFSASPASVAVEIGRAGVLLELRRPVEAEAACRRALTRDPTNIRALRSLMRSLVRQDRPADALLAFADGPYRDASLPALLGALFDALMLCHRFDEARPLFAEHLKHAAGLESFELLFEYNPRLHEGWPRSAAWIEMESALTDLPRPEDAERSAAIDALHARIRLALRDREGFARLARRATDGGDLFFQGLSLRRVVEAVSRPAVADRLRPKIFGIGLSKTATTTLAAALNALGFATVHWTNPFTEELFCDDDVALFDGFTDLPVCEAFEKYYYLYPNSKFLYTLRDIDDWRESVAKHWTFNYCKSDLRSFQSDLASGKEFHYGARYRDLYHSLIFGRDDLSKSFDAYDRRVRGFFADKPKQRLLVFDAFAGDGWPELCDFLGVDAPPMDFPRKNAAPA